MAVRPRVFLQGFSRRCRSIFSCQVVAERDLINEILTVYRLVRIPFAKIGASK